jgi:N6-adenosine-specific RNA methylase IME4
LGRLGERAATDEYGAMTNEERPTEVGREGRPTPDSGPARSSPKAYRTIVIDPPWTYKTSRGITTRTRGDGTFAPEARGNYATMTIAELAALPVGEWSADDAHLYLWTTNPLLPEALPLVQGWGFRYVTLLTWRKLGTLGMGYYFRGDTEHVVFAVRGRQPIAAKDRQRNWFAARKLGHSRKPDLFYEMVERVSPGPYLELFARRRRYGWDVWGNEAPEFAASQAEMGLLA